MKYYGDAVTKICNDMGGLDYFETTTSDDRMCLWSAMWDEDRKGKAISSSCSIVKYIPMDDIYSSETPEKKK